MTPFVATTTYLTEQLRPWLEYFDDGKARWGLITDVRSDGSTYKRHGVVVELVVTNAHEFVDKELVPQTHVPHGDQLREAIDLVKLVLAVDPMAIAPLLLRYADAPYDEADLRALFQTKTPVELRVRLEFGDDSDTTDMTYELVTYFMEQLSNRSHWTSDELRRRFISLAHQNLRDVPGYKASTFRRLRYVPVSVTVALDQYDYRTSYAFFEDLTHLAHALQSHHQHQQDTPWSMGDWHAPLVVDQFDLRLEQISITRGVVQAAAAFCAVGIRVLCPKLCVATYRTTCGEADLTAFMQGITRQTPMVHIQTGHHEYSYNDGNGEDSRGSIRAMLNSIAAIRKPITVDLSRIFLFWNHAFHRKAVIRGLFEAILMRSAPTSLIVQAHTLKEEDISEIYRCRREWREQNPTKPIRLTSLDLSLDNQESAHALLASLDDVEELKLLDYSTKADTILTVLRLPSLRRLRLKMYTTRLSIESMELFDPSVEDPRLPHKPCLEFLEIEGLILEKPESLRWFIQRLDPTVEAPSPLAKTLHTLAITQRTEIRIDRKTDLSDPYFFVRVAVHDQAVVDAVREVSNTNRTLRHVNFVGDCWYRPPSVDRYPEGHVRCDHHLPAPPELRRSRSARARNASFLSVVRAAARSRASAIGRFDSRTVQRILDLSAPHVYCTLKLETKQS